jgi:signal transduction histidine kinase
MQALIGSIVITLGITLAAIVVRHSVIEQRVHSEAEAFWLARSIEPDHRLPVSSTMTSYLVPAGGSDAGLPESLRGLAPGLHSFPEPGRMAYVSTRPQGTLYLVFSAWMADQSVLLTGLVSLLLSLLTSGALIWLTYRTSKRLVTPVSWLANRVAQWDPRDPDASAIAPGRLPADASEEVRQLSQALGGLARRLNEFVERERDFTRDASHELRTPLTVIRVATDLMATEPDLAPRVQRSLDRVKNAGRDMEAVIDAFLILARESDVAPLSEEFAVRDIVDAEVAKVKPALAGKAVELNIRDEGAPRLTAPRHVLSVMVGNLLENAVRYTDEGRIDLLLAGDRIEIRDSGIGMTPETLAKAFDPFFRADRQSVDGRGMGLSIVRRLGERFGWPVTLSSEPGQGTQAVIRFSH